MRMSVEMKGCWVTRGMMWGLSRGIRWPSCIAWLCGLQALLLLRGCCPCIQVPGLLSCSGMHAAGGWLILQLAMCCEITRGLARELKSYECTRSGMFVVTHVSGQAQAHKAVSGLVCLRLCVSVSLCCACVLYVNSCAGGLCVVTYLVWCAPGLQG